MLDRNDCADDENDDNDDANDDDGEIDFYSRILFRTMPFWRYFVFTLKWRKLRKDQRCNNS